MSLIELVKPLDIMVNFFFFNFLIDVSSMIFLSYTGFSTYFDSVYQFDSLIINSIVCPNGSPGFSNCFINVTDLAPCGDGNSVVFTTCTSETY